MGQWVAPLSHFCDWVVNFFYVEARMRFILDVAVVSSCELSLESGEIITEQIRNRTYLHKNEDLKNMKVDEVSWLSWNG